MAASSVWMIGATLGGVAALGVVARYLLAGNDSDSGDRRRRPTRDSGCDVPYWSHGGGADSTRHDSNHDGSHDTGLDAHHSTGTSCDSSCDCSCDAGGGDGGGGGGD